jgi:hypothetical protein
MAEAIGVALLIVAVAFIAFVVWAGVCAWRQE